MFFDDRLATVLRKRASSDVGRRTQFRQLLDILGSERAGRGHARDQSLMAAAWLRLDALADVITAADRARMIREPGWRFRNPELAAHLSNFEPDVASAALNRAQLSSEDWTALIPRLPVRARGFLRLRRDLPVDAEKLLDRLGVSDRGLPAPPTATEPDDTELVLDTEAELEDVPTPPPAKTGNTPTQPAKEPERRTDPVVSVSAPFDPDTQGRSEISALVERIAQFKKTRESGSEFDPSEEPRLPLGEAFDRNIKLARAFGFAADAAGRIEWAEADVASMVIGTRLVAPPKLGSEGQGGALERAFVRRQPIEAAAKQLDGAEAIAGDWIVDALPRFTENGNFAGYVGRFRRPATADPAAPTAAEREGDRIRQLLHELRTPITAVQGYAEVIQQQLFGTAPHEYRALAAAIAADAAHILAGFEELDRLAKLETGMVEIDSGATDLAALARRTNAQLSQVLHPRMAGIELELDDTPHVVAIDPDQGEALLWRLLATLGGGCAAGEMLVASISSRGGMAELSCELPAQLIAEEDVFAAEVRPIGTAINAGLFGAGFALRLARAEARAAGGGLLRVDETIVLSLPLVMSDADSEALLDA